jgi:hypothetical protein
MVTLSVTSVMCWDTLSQTAANGWHCKRQSSTSSEIRMKPNTNSYTITWKTPSSPLGYVSIARIHNVMARIVNRPLILTIIMRHPCSSLRHSAPW